MQQSRLLITTQLISRAPFFFRPATNLTRGFASSSGGRTADPAVFSDERDREVQPAVPSGQPEETRDHYEPDNSKREPKEPNHRPESETNPLSPPKPPHSSSTRLETVGVHNPAQPQSQQKRSYTSASPDQTEKNLESATCAGLDGSPWPEPDEGRQSKAGDAAYEDDKEYFEHHKASPLSEIEFADSRKPVTRATDGPVAAGNSDVVGWSPEQVVAAEETMERASRMFRERAARGDPDSPHGRALRSLRR
ncbi:hypothetical protein LINPERHAP2_LOCUS43593, partial [Linum perenne]